MGRGRPRKHPLVLAVVEDGAAGGMQAVEEALLYPVGAEVEVCSDDPGFVGSFYEATVTAHLSDGGGYEVLYGTLQGEDGEPLRETAAAAQVRPRPPRAEADGGGAAPRREYAMCEMVEAFHNEGWWPGVVTVVPPPPVEAGNQLPQRLYKVTFPMSRELLEFEETALRPHRVFQGGQWIPVAEAENGSPLFSESSQVEVSRFAEKFGKAWSPATISKVIGAKNYLVQYRHVGEDGELVNEILDSQYIRPARAISHMGSKHRFSPSSHVEIFHDGSWWPGIIMNVLMNGYNKKYDVKLKSLVSDKLKTDEGHWDDVQFVDVLRVEFTQLRPRFDWIERKWKRCMTKKSANKRPQSTPRKRPISAALVIYNGGDEIRDKPDKRLKNAEGISEQISSSLSVYSPEQMVKPQNAVLTLESQWAPPLLLSTAGLGHVNVSPVEQSSSQMIIIPSVPQSGQLHASLFGAFGQLRSLSHSQGTTFGMQLLNQDFEHEDTDAGSFVESVTDQSRKIKLSALQTPEAPRASKETAAKTNAEASNIVAIFNDLTKPTQGDDVELSKDANPSCGIPTDENTVSCKDPTPQEDNKGLQERSGIDDVQKGGYVEALRHDSTNETVVTHKSMLYITLGNPSDENVFSSESSTQYGSKATQIDKFVRSVEQDTCEDVCHRSLAMKKNAKVVSLPSAKSCEATEHHEQLCKDNTVDMAFVTGTVVSTENLLAANEQTAGPQQHHISAMSECAAEGNQSIQKSAVPQLPTICTSSHSTETDLDHSLSIPKSVEVTPISKYVGSTTDESSCPAARSIFLCENVLDNQLPEYLAAENLPFVKSSPWWAQIEAMEIFSKASHKPNFHQYQQYPPDIREGMAIGLMFSFANLAESLNKLNVQDCNALFEEKMKSLCYLEESGFDVNDLRSRMETLLNIKKLRAELQVDMKKLEEKIAHEVTDDRQLGAQIGMLTSAIQQHDLGGYLLRSARQSAVLERMNKAMKISRLKMEANKLEQSYLSMENWFVPASM